MAGDRRSGKPTAVADIAADILDPVLRKRAGMSLALVQSWEEIVGPRLGPTTRPEKIQWARRLDDNDPYQPAVLVVACEGLAALHLQHETTEVLSRINSFLGFGAIGRIRIVQKPVVRMDRPEKPRLRKLSDAETRQIGGVVAGIEDEGLRESLARLGATIKAVRRA